MLEITQLSKTFHAGTRNEVRPLQGVNLNVEAGSFVIVVGTNGSGKSTLLNAVAGSFLPDAGRISLAGHDITRWPEHRRARLIGRVFQNPFSGTAPGISIEENLAMATQRGTRRGLGWALPRSLCRDFQERVGDLRMGLEGRLDTEIGTLSGGQRQALTLLMATWRRPELLLLDEHTAALDPRSADNVVRLTQQVVSRDKLTTLMVTHSMQQAVNLGDRIVMMHRGSVAYRFEGADKQRLHVEDLLARFEELRRREMLDDSVATFLQQTYI